MPSATFVADFSQFQAAVNAATISLKDFEGDANKVARSLDKMADTFSGATIRQQAALAQKAIEDIGGASKLTAKEQERVNGILEEALAKYAALGKEAPAGMQKLADATKKAALSTETLAAGVVDVDMKKFAAETGQVTQSMGGLKDISTELLGAFGLLFSVGAAVNFGKQFVSSVFDGASALVDLNQKTGLSIEYLQRLKAVGVESGVAIEDFAQAATNLGIKLSGGGQSVRQAVEELGLSWDKLKTQTPDQQLNATLAALERIVEPQERNRLGVELLGKTWQTVAPAVAAGYQQIADAARVSTDAQVRVLNDLSADFERMKNDLQTAAMSEIASLFLIRDAVKTLPPGLVEVIDQTSATKLSIEQLDEVLIRAAKHWHDIPLPVETVTKATVDYVVQLRAAQAEVDGLTATQRKGIDAAIALGTAQDKVQETYFKTEGALKLYLDRQREAEVKAREQIAITREAVKETEKMEELWAKVAAVESNATTQTDAFGKALKAIGTNVPKPELEAYQIALAKITTKTKELSDASMGAALMQDRLNAAAGITATTHETAADKVNKLVGEINAAGGMAMATEAKLMELTAAQQAAAKEAQTLGAGVDSGSDAMKRMTQVATGLVQGLDGVSEAAQLAYEHALAVNTAFGNLGGVIQGAAGLGMPVPGISQFQATSGLPHFQSGGPVNQTGPAFLHAGEYVVPKGGGTGSGMNVTIQVTQPLGTPTEIARVVGEALTVQLRTLGIRQPWT